MRRTTWASRTAPSGLGHARHCTLHRSPRIATPPHAPRGSRQHRGFQLADPSRALLATAPAVTDDAMYGYPERLLLGCLSGVSIVASTRMRPPHRGQANTPTANVWRVRSGHDHR